MPESRFQLRPAQGSKSRKEQQQEYGSEQQDFTIKVNSESGDPIRVSNDMFQSFNISNQPSQPQASYTEKNPFLHGDKEAEGKPDK
mmetsp:Transcript_6066/g.10294  ORF Transcript_6066/g.10294 Transcript_6066/m.10294 type:complete len:86 (+) Transcript_6066:485-742(+)